MQLHVSSALQDLQKFYKPHLVPITMLSFWATSAPELKAPAKSVH